MTLHTLAKYEIRTLGRLTAVWQADYVGESAISDADLLGSALKSVTGGGISANMMQNVLGSGINVVSGRCCR